MSGAKPTQLSAAALALMTPAEISRAKAEGRLDALLAGHTSDMDAVPARTQVDAFRAGPPMSDGELNRLVDELTATPEPVVQLSAADLAGMSPEAIVAAKAAGQLDTLLGRQTP